MRLAAVAAVVLALGACGQPVEIEPPPGNQWFDASGEPVSAEVISVALGPAACGWDQAGFLELEWPLGPAPGEETEHRQYVRNVDASVPSTALQAPYDGGATLPQGAVYTGLHTDHFQLWVGPDADQWIYIVAGPTVEAWPRADPPLTCE